MSRSESKLKGLRFWLSLGILNHLIVILIVALAWGYSFVSHEEDAMKEALSVYAFTLFTPQLALEVILIMALFLMTGSIKQIKTHRQHWLMFVVSLMPIVFFTAALW